MRRDSSFSLSVAPSWAGSGLGAVAPPSGGRPGGSISDCSGTGGHQVTVNHSTSKAASNSIGGILPPSDASISSSIDCPRPCAGVAGTKVEVAAAAVAEAARGPGEVVWDGGVRIEAGSIGLSAGGRSTPGDLESWAGKKTMPNGVTPRGERRRGGGRWKRGGGGGGRMTWNVRDADIASGLARRGRLGDSSLGIVGTRSLITSEDR